MLRSQDTGTPERASQPVQPVPPPVPPRPVPPLPGTDLSGLDLPDLNDPEAMKRHFLEVLGQYVQEEYLPLPKTRWYQRFLRPRRRQYPDNGGEDPFPMEELCRKGRRHVFIERTIYQNSCQPTVPKRIYLCRRCGEVYRGLYPTRYGDVVGEDPIPDLAAEWKKRSKPSRKRWPLLLLVLGLALIVLSRLGGA